MSGQPTEALIAIKHHVECVSLLGEEHYNCISALHKSMRGSHESAALYWLGRMLEGGEDPLYVARRLVRFACEDVGELSPRPKSYDDEHSLIIVTLNGQTLK